MAGANDVICTELLWWRRAGGMRTVISLYWDPRSPELEQVVLRAILHDGDGAEQARWTLPLATGKATFIDSDAPGPWNEVEKGDGLLALSICAPASASSEARNRCSRLSPMVDWCDSDGRVATLHSDQFIDRRRQDPQQFTEIVVREHQSERNSLVILNGEARQEGSALALTLTNDRRESRTAVYGPPMTPFSLHRIELSGLFPGLDEFSDGKPLQVAGTFAGTGLFTRPYIETTGDAFGTYHGGDLYVAEGLPYFAHALIGGEVNPVAVLHDETTRTFVNLLRSHVDQGADPWVNARLFDEQGMCVAERSRWRKVARGDLERFDIAELLPTGTGSFRGHIALGFDAEPGQKLPLRLQALLEYRKDRSVARTMTWSDEWNSRPRLARRDARAQPPVSRSVFRVIGGGGLSTEVAVTNAGHPGYDRHAIVVASMHDGKGLMAEHEFHLAPFATLFASVEDLFPDIGEFSLAWIVISSVSDLACMAFTRHRPSGSLSAEHFLPLSLEFEGMAQHVSGS